MEYLDINLIKSKCKYRPSCDVFGPKMYSLDLVIDVFYQNVWNVVLTQCYLEFDKRSFLTWKVKYSFIPNSSEQTVFI